MVLSSSGTAVNLPSWWSYKVVAVSWEIPSASLHLDPSPLMSTFKDGRQSLQQSSITSAQILKSPTQQLFGWFLIKRVVCVWMIVVILLKSFLLH